MKGTIFATAALADAGLGRHLMGRAFGRSD